MPHLFTFNGHGTFSPDGKVDVSADQAKVINADTDRQELEYWATKPERFCPAYYHFPEAFKGTPNVSRFYGAPVSTETASAYVTTWSGTRIGTIIDARVYRHNFGGRFVSIRVKGTNGAMYYGRASWDGGTIIRLRRAK